jgi:peptidoglycan/xylan/chitin deacetylase (PgdA/CDA1 family)
MLHSIAKMAAALDVDSAANRLMECLYRNRRRAIHFSRRFQILGYHKVSPVAHPYFEPVHPAVFEEQMLFLKRCYRVMDLSEVVERSQRGDLPDRAVAITFDDGYFDNYKYAFPILKKYRLPATIFVATGVIETGKVLWHDRLFNAFRFATVERSRLSDPELPEVVMFPAEAREKSLWQARARTSALYGERQLRLVEEIEQKLRPNLPADQEDSSMLSWEQIREMHGAGIRFGSHTVNHPILSRLPKDIMVTELRESKRVLSDQLDFPVCSFAYPNGQTSDYNDEVKWALRDCGYSLAVTSQCGFNGHFSDRYELKRGQPWQKEIELFRLAFFLQRHGLAS